ncbi:hypothetical protein ACOMHN_028226 [Nucella lapillus]
MRVCVLLLAVLTASSISRAEEGENNSHAYSSGDHSGGDYAAVKASRGGAGSGGGGGGGVTYLAGGVEAGAGGWGGGLGRGFQVGGVSSLDRFGSAFDGGAQGKSYQRGTAQVNWQDRALTRAQEQANQKARHFNNADAGASRSDDQDRRGQQKQNAYNSQDQQSRGSQSHQSGSQQESVDQGSESGQKQIEVKDKHGSSLNSDGRYNRKDQAVNAGKKALSASKNASSTLDNNFANIDYGFNKNFKNNVNERGGSKDSVGQDNTHSDVYEENQKDSRISKGFRDGFRKYNGNSALRKESDWLSNAAQAQKLNNRYGAADRLKNSANQNNADFNALFDRRNDVFWHRDAARDQSLRQANDEARKLADQKKSAVAQASGKKGVVDSKVYFGGSGGQGGGYGQGSGAGVNTFPIAGHSRAGTHAGTAGNPYGNPGSGPVGSGGVVRTGDIAGRTLGSPVKSQQEGSGGSYLNQYGENARQADNGGQKESSQAQSDAKALNDYSKGRGVDDSVELRGARQGKWAKDRSGLRDALAQGFNGAAADASKKADLSDRDLDHRQSSSVLDSADKSLQDQRLDRINYKKNQVDTNQKVHKQKKFYHDKKEDGQNDEALNYNRKEGNHRTGEKQRAHKDARTSYNNAADDAKVNQQGRSYSNLDGRQVSLADAFSRAKDQAGGWRKVDSQAEDQAQKHKAAADTGRQNSELDTFTQKLSNRQSQLWDKAQDSQARKDQGSQRDRTLAGIFQFGPLSPGSAQGSQGFGGSGNTRLPSSSFGGSQFGASSLGGASKLGGSNFGGSPSGGSNFGGSPSGGSNFGGSPSGGSNFGGSSSGGSKLGGSQSGGSNFGGSYPGGSNSGGSPSGGSNFGGSSSGGSKLGGSQSGGSNFGGRYPGGSKSGGSPSGGSNFGGSASGGSKLGGSPSGGSNFGGSRSGGSNFGGSYPGSSNSGKSKFDGSSFSGGFDSPLGGFMDNIGNGKFGGVFSFGQSPSSGQSSSSGYPDSSNNKWRRK